MKKKRKNKHKRKKFKNGIKISQVVAESASVHNVVIYKSELDYISRCILDYKNIETGGQLFGFVTLSGTPVVLYAIGPGRKANHQSTFFNQELTYLETVGRRLVNVYGLQHIGEWHSHHQLGLPHPSGHDANNLRCNVEKLGLSQFLLCIGTCTNTSTCLNVFPFQQGKSSYNEARWVVKDIDSPFRKVIDMELKDILTHPRSDKANMVGLKILNERPQYTGSYWMNEKGNGLVLKSILDHINNIWSTQAKVILDDAKQVHIIAMHNGEEVDIHFPKAFPQDSPMLYKQGRALQLDTEWQYNGDILQAFKTIINKYTINL